MKIAISTSAILLMALCVLQNETDGNQKNDVNPIDKEKFCNDFCRSVGFNKHGIFYKTTNECGCHKDDESRQIKVGPMCSLETKYPFNDAWNAKPTKTQICTVLCQNAIARITRMKFGCYLKRGNRRECVCYEADIFFTTVVKKQLKYKKNEEDEEDDCIQFCANNKYVHKRDELRYTSCYTAKIFRIGHELDNDWTDQCRCYKRGSHIMSYNENQIGLSMKKALDEKEICQLFCSSFFLYVFGYHDKENESCLCAKDGYRNDRSSWKFPNTFKLNAIRNTQLTRTQNCDIDCRQTDIGNSMFHFGVYHWYHDDEGILRHECACFLLGEFRNCLDNLETLDHSKFNLEHDEYLQEDLCNCQCQETSKSFWGYYVATIIRKEKVALKAWNQPCYCYNITESKKRIMYRTHDLNNCKIN